MDKYVYLLISITHNPMSYSGETAENIVGAFEDEETAKIYRKEHEIVSKGLGMPSEEYIIDKIKLIKLNKIKKAR